MSSLMSSGANVSLWVSGASRYRALFLFFCPPAYKSRAFDAAVQKNKNASLSAGTFCICCDPAGIRTQDPYIKSVMLYRLSYGIILIFRYLAV